MKKTLKFSLVLCLYSGAFAGVVNPNFAYQNYLDFGANKGKFGVGQNMSVVRKDGKVIDFKVPMPDFSAANQSGALMSELTNIGGSYAITAAHMISPRNRPDLIVKGKSYEFGNVKSKVIASDTNFKEYSPSTIKDFAVVKMSKLNINKSAKLISQNFYFKNPNLANDKLEDQQELYLDKYFLSKSFCEEMPNSPECKNYKDALRLSGETENENIGKGFVLNNPQRFSVYVRSGSGAQKIGYDNSNPTNIAPNDEYITGGVLYTDEYTSRKSNGILHFNSVTNDKRLDFSNNSAPGDSGSVIYVYDELLKDWFAIGVVSYSDCDGGGINGFVCSYTSYALINHHIINDFKNDFTTALSGGTYSSSIINTAVQDKHGEKNKDIVFNGATSINLAQTNEILGSSVFYFNDNSSLNGGEVLFGGVVIDENKTLDFNAKIGANDNLHKMGKGILNVNKESLGGLRTGEGETLLNTNGKAFSSVYLLNDAVLKITNANQIDLNATIFNGGTLDLNGVSLNANTIKANDIRTKIINSSNALSSISLNQNAIYHGQIGKNIDVKIGANDVVFDGALDINTLSLSSGKAILQGHPLTHSKVIYLDGNPLVGDVYTATSVKLEQDDWEQREFNINDISVKNSSLDVLKHATLNANKITLENSSLNIGENTAYIDGHDGHNIVSDTFYQSTFTSGSSAAKDIFVNANVFLNANSSLNIKNGAVFKGSINGDINGTLNSANANIYANINVANLNATNTSFYLDKDKSIISTQSTLGYDNSVKLDINGLYNGFLIASLKGSLNENYFTFPSVNDGISIITYDISFENDNGSSKWYLGDINKTLIAQEKPNEQINKENLSEFFIVKENEEAVQMIDVSLNQVFFSYVLEWNNLHKRMGELRDNSYDSGVWTRFYGGGSSYLYASKTKFYEVQVGVDKKLDSNGYSVYTGFVLNSSVYNLSGSLDGSVKGYGGGVYGSFIFDNGFYFDSILKYIHYKNNFDLIVANDNNDKIKASNNSKAIIASAEIGYRAWFDKFYLEPQFELISGYVGEQNLNHDKIKLKSSSFIPLNLKTAVFSGYISDDFSLRGGIGMAVDMAKNADKTISDDFISKVVEGKKDKRMFINFGTGFNLGDNSRLSVEFERTFFGDLDIDYSLNAVYRHSF